MANRALLVGINAYASAPLGGCVNDVVDMARLLVSRYGFKDSEIRLIVDGRATTAAILERMEWLVTGVRAGDRLVFHYSGHGVQLPSRNSGGEVTEVQDAICPVDFDWSEEHAIRGSELQKRLKVVPQGTDFVWVSDSCFSGGLVRTMRGKPKTIVPPADMAWRLHTSRSLAIKSVTFEHIVKDFNGVLVSGCRADQTSADAVFDNRANGALTYFLLQELEKRDGSNSLVNCVRDVRADLKSSGFDQEPQLSGSAALMQSPFLGGVTPGRELLPEPMPYTGEVAAYPAGDGRGWLDVLPTLIPPLLQAMRSAEWPARQTREPMDLNDLWSLLAGLASAQPKDATQRGWLDLLPTILPPLLQALKKAEVPAQRTQRILGVDDALAAAIISAIPAIINATKSRAPLDPQASQRIFGIDDALVAALVAAIPGIIQAVHGKSFQTQTALPVTDVDNLAQAVLAHRS